MYYTMQFVFKPEWWSVLPEWDENRNLSFSADTDEEPALLTSEEVSKGFQWLINSCFAEEGITKIEIVPPSPS
jgi:hypothetical protein